MSRKRYALATGLIACLTWAVTPAFARDEEDMNSRQNQSSQSDYGSDYSSNYGQSSNYDSDYGSSDNRSYDSDSYRSNRGNRNSRNESGADLDGWVRVAYDYDNDGAYDAVEYLLVYDLEQAREASQARQGRSQSGNQNRFARSNRSNMNWRQHATGQRGRYGAKRYRMRGSLENFRTVQLSGVDQPHLVAKLKTDNDRKVCVDLGPRQKVQNNLDLENGQTVTIYGVRGSINDQRTLIAQHIEAGNQSYDIQRKRGVALRRIDGRVIDTQQMRLRNDGNRLHTVATVRLNNNRTTKVALGNASAAQNLNIERGDQISVLAKPTRINGQPALVAKSVRIGGETHQVNQQMASMR